MGQSQDPSNSSLGTHCQSARVTSSMFHVFLCFLQFCTTQAKQGWGGGRLPSLARSPCPSLAPIRTPFNLSLTLLLLLINSRLRKCHDFPAFSLDGSCRVDQHPLSVVKDDAPLRQEPLTTSAGLVRPCLSSREGRRNHFDQRIIPSPKHAMVGLPHVTPKPT